MGPKKPWQPAKAWCHNPAVTGTDE